MGENDDIIKDFLVESAENLDQMDRDFITLEEDPSNKEVLARIFRAIHTIKGTCGFFGFSFFVNLVGSMKRTSWPSFTNSSVKWWILW